MTPNSDQTNATVQVFRPTLSDGDYVDALDAEGLLLLDIAESRSFDADIAFCPGWILSELITHLGYIYRWVGVIVGQGRTGTTILHDLLAKFNFFQNLKGSFQGFRLLTSQVKRFSTTKKPSKEL